MPLSDAEKTLVAEAVGEPEEGVFLAASVIMNRARARGKSPNEIVAEPHQFAGFSRPDLDAFVGRQSPEAIAKVQRAFNRALTKPQQGITNFLTTELFDDKERRPAWADAMVEKKRVGNHVFLGLR